MGARGANREPATPEDLANMYAITHEAISAGALGLATSMLFTHRTRDGDLVPTFGAAEEELQTLARAVRDAGFEIGIHCYNHYRWQDHLPTMSLDAVRREFGAARDEFREAARSLAAVKLPRSAEPATRFEA